MHLNCKTFFSYRYGTCSTKDLVQQAAALGIGQLALTNINGTADIWDFVYYCQQQGISPVAGVELRNGDTLIAVLLARSAIGLCAINRWLSMHLQAKEPFPVRCPIAGEAVVAIYPLGTVPASKLSAHEYIGVGMHQLSILHRHYAAGLQHRFVALQPATFLHARQYSVHRLLRAIDHNILLSRQMGEYAHTLAQPHEVMLSPQQLLRAYASHPFLLQQAVELLNGCSIHMDFGTDKSKKHYTSSLADDMELLRHLALEGMGYRYGQSNKQARERVERELGIIEQLRFAAYFLISWDVVRYARHRGFYYVGRGSGANSIVAFCLQITDVDPIELDLYFERFLNPYRSAPPDFDIDFSWRDRDEVIAYVLKRYGSDYVGLLGMYTTFQRKAMARELGKVWGLPKAELDAWALDGHQQATDSVQATILQYSALMQDFPNHLSIHPGGILVTEEPIYQYTALELPPKGFATTQIDMFVADKINVSKLDILSQRGLGHIKDAIGIVRQNKQQELDIHRIADFKKDPLLAEQIRKANTIGCFYIESPAMRQLLRKLACDDYITLVAASSIIRPGVAQSGMMKEYILRYHNPERVQYLHPKMKELLQETYGVMVYQEDVIKVAHHFAGLDMGEADILRRAMSGKYRGKEQMLRIERTFFENCAARGYPLDISKEVWRQIASFSGYSFSKAHSASFAVESYQSLFLKAYYPMEFMVAVINNFGGFYSTELYFHELKRAGATVLPPCINEGHYYTSISGSRVWVGFIHLQGIEQRSVEAILQERELHGPYASLYELVKRTNISVEQLNLLIRIGALRSIDPSKQALLWQANFLLGRHHSTPPALSLFEEPPTQYTLPELHHHPIDDALDELELLGFTLSNPFDYIAPHNVVAVPADDMQRYAGRPISMLGYLITTKTLRTSKGGIMCFGTFIDADGQWLDTVHFPASLSRYPIRGKGFYHLRGIVAEELGQYSLNVQYLEKLGFVGRDAANATDGPAQHYKAGVATAKRGGIMAPGNGQELRPAQ